MNIIIVSNEPWGDIWFSKHHYANELSRSHNVVFINPCSSWTPLNLFRFKIQRKIINPNLWVIDYYNFLPHYFLELNNRIVSKRIGKYLAKQDFEVNIFWSFDPIRLCDPSLFHSDISVFHAMDKYLLTNPAEVILLQKVDAFISVSNDFVTAYQKYDKPILVKPHGVSSDEFEVDETEFKVEHENYILYLGTIDFRLDYPFISKLLKSFNNEKFVFLGGMRDSKDPVFRNLFIDKIPDNLIILPPVHAKKVKYFIHKSKCCIAPMTKDLAGNLISHHKIFQYFTHGKAVFSPVFTEYLSMSHLIYMDNDSNELLGKLNRFLEEGENPKLKMERIEVSKEHQYSSILNDIFVFLHKIGQRTKV